METAPEKKPGNPVLIAICGVVTLAGLVAVIAVAALGPGSSSPIASVPVDPQPAETRFVVATPGTIQVWADVHVDTGNIDHDGDLPHVMNYVVEIMPGGGAPQTLRCNPFNCSFSRMSGEGYRGNIYFRAYEGRIRGCEFELPAGTHKVRVHSEPVKPDKRIQFKKNTLLLRPR